MKIVMHQFTSQQCTHQLFPSTKSKVNSVQVSPHHSASEPTCTDLKEVEFNNAGYLQAGKQWVRTLLVNSHCPPETQKASPEHGLSMTKLGRSKGQFSGQETSHRVPNRAANCKPSCSGEQWGDSARGERKRKAQRLQSKMTTNLV